jgi:hypothetical protein
MINFYLIRSSYQIKAQTLTCKAQTAISGEAGDGAICLAKTALLTNESVNMHYLSFPPAQYLPTTQYPYLYRIRGILFIFHSS